MESPFSEEIIQEVMDNSVDEGHNPNNSCILSNVCAEEAFQAIVILNNLFLHEKKK